VTTTRPAPTVASAAVDGFGPPPAPRPARSLAGALLGAMLIVFCGAAVAFYTSTVGHRRVVLMVARPVSAGAVIQSTDLAEVRVAADPAVHTVPAAARAGIVGRIADLNLVPGTLLTPGELGDGPRADATHAIVGLALKPGQFPAGLRSLDRAIVVDTGPSSGPSINAPAVLVADSQVTATAVAADGQTTIVSVLVPRAEAPSVAAASSRGQISLILIGGRDGG
jgi:hypothetical protein